MRVLDIDDPYNRHKSQPTPHPIFSICGKKNVCFEAYNDRLIAQSILWFYLELQELQNVRLSISAEERSASE